MTATQIVTILSLLLSFGVDAPTVSKIGAMLIPTTVQYHVIPLVPQKPVVGSSVVPKICQENLTVSYGYGTATGFHENEVYPYNYYDAAILKINGSAVCESAWYVDYTSDVPGFESGRGYVSTAPYRSNDGTYPIRVNMYWVPLKEEKTYTFHLTVHNKDYSIKDTGDITITSGGIYQQK